MDHKGETINKIKIFLVPDERIAPEFVEFHNLTDGDVVFLDNEGEGFIPARFLPALKDAGLVKADGSGSIYFGPSRPVEGRVNWPAFLHRLDGDEW